MKRNNKKGFTIVELVIVIAVIAILAAVLIPTFSSVVKKANMSADQQAARQMNTALAMENCKTIDEATAVLVEAGYNADKTLIPVSSNHTFYWYATYNTVVLVNEKDGAFELVYPTNNKDIVDNIKNDQNSGKLHNLQVVRSKTEVSDEANLEEAISNGQNVVIKTDAPQTITLEPSAEKHKMAGRKTGLIIKEDDVVSLDLGGNTLEMSSSEDVAIVVEGELVISNGTVISRGITVVAGGKLTIEEGVTIEATGANGGQAVRNEGGVVVINGGTFKALNGDTPTSPDKEPSCVYNSGYMVINGGTFTANSGAYALVASGGTTIINGGTFDASRGGVSATGDVYFEINGGSFTSRQEDSAYALYFVGDEVNAKLKVTGGIFNNAAGGNDAHIAGGISVEVSSTVLVQKGTSEKWNAPA